MRGQDSDWVRYTQGDFAACGRRVPLPMAAKEPKRHRERHILRQSFISVGAAHWATRRGGRLRSHPHLSRFACLPTPFGLRPFPPDRGNRPSPKGEGLRATARVAPTQETNRERWFGKPRRRSGTASVPIFFPLRPPVGPDGMAPNHSDFARRKFLPGSRGNPRKWGPGKGEYERGALILSRSLSPLALRAISP